MERDFYSKSLNTCIQIILYYNNRIIILILWFLEDYFIFYIRSSGVRFNVKRSNYNLIIILLIYYLRIWVEPNNNFENGYYWMFFTES